MADLIFIKKKSTQPYTVKIRRYTHLYLFHIL